MAFTNVKQGAYRDVHLKNNKIDSRTVEAPKFFSKSGPSFFFLEIARDRNDSAVELSDPLPPDLR